MLATRSRLGDPAFESGVGHVAGEAAVPKGLEGSPSRRFERRVVTAAELAATEGADWTALDLPAQETYYQRAKAIEAEALSATDPEGPA